MLGSGGAGWQRIPQAVAFHLSVEQVVSPMPWCIGFTSSIPPQAPVRPLESDEFRRDSLFHWKQGKAKCFQVWADPVGNRSYLRWGAAVACHTWTRCWMRPQQAAVAADTSLPPSFPGSSPFRGWRKLWAPFCCSAEVTSLSSGRGWVLRVACWDQLVPHPLPPLCVPLLQDKTFKVKGKTKKIRKVRKSTILMGRGRPQ